MRVITLYMDDDVYRGLRQEAAKKGRKVEEEALQIISASVQPLPPDDSEPRTGKEFYESIRAIYEPIGWTDDVELPSRRCCEHECSVDSRA